MLFNSYIVFAYILVFIGVYNAVKYLIKSRFLKNFILIIANMLVLLNFVKEHSLIVISIISLLVYIAGLLLQRSKSKVLFSFSILFIVILFVIRNYPFIQELLQKTFLSWINEPVLSVQKVGISYILFRFVHWLIESYRRNIHKSDFATFLNYIFFFPTFLAGPIDQYKNFHFWIGNLNLKYHRSLFLAGVTRIFIGAVKTIGLVPLIINYATDYTLLENSMTSFYALLFSLFLYSLYIYLDFSGYSDIAIGTAYLIGIKIPENFNNPYFSPNLSVFWKRWHITFSNFLFAYVFKPLISFYNLFLSKQPRMLVTVFGYMTTFFVCGIWHGSTVNFIYWGLWHGVGLSINKFWTNYAKKKSFSDSNIYKVCSVLLTFTFVTIGWMFFQYNQEQLIIIFNKVL